MGWQDRQYARAGTPWQSRLPGMGRGFAGFRGLSVTLWLIIINVVIFLVDMVLGPWRGQDGPLFMLGFFSRTTALHEFQLWRFITYQFLHADPGHLLFNMIGLYFFGPIMEQWWGSRRFLAFYLLCGLSSAWLYSVLSYTGVLYGDPKIPLVGASGALFGILIGCALVAPQLRVLLFFIIPTTIRTLAAFILVYALVAVLLNLHNAGGEAGHLGGALLGFALVKWPRSLDWAGGPRRAAALAAPRDSRINAVKKWMQQRQEKAVADEEAEVDRILAKVKAQGLHSLSDKEKRTLQRATERRRD
ncbi:MAG: rhomboid family intramembrane serine protease [Phycisphaeraceae bacterium]